MGADCVHFDVVTVTLIDQNDLTIDQEPETYTGLSEDWKRRWYEHGRSIDHSGSPASEQKQHSANTFGN